MSTHRQDEYMEMRGKASAASNHHEQAVWLKLQVETWTNELFGL